jgi:hypothetical protein
MLSKKQVEEGGYEVLPEGGWVRLDPTIVPHDWMDLCKDFGVDPDCKEMILCICGVKEIPFEEGDGDA